MLVTFKGPLIPQAIPNQLTFWALYRPYSIQSDLGIVDLPELYVTDFASIPQFAWSIAHPLDLRVAWIAPGHDRMYETHEMSKADADDLLYWGMIASQAGETLAMVFWRAVKIFGQKYYDTGPQRREERQKKADALRHQNMFKGI